MLGRQLAQHSIELVAVDQQPNLVPGRLYVDGCQAHLDHASTTPAGLVNRGVDDKSVEPGVETLRIAQSGQVAPGPDERLLDRIARELAVAEDQAGGRVESRCSCPREHREGVAIAPTCAFHERPLVHGPSLRGATRLAALVSYGAGARRFVSLAAQVRTRGDLKMQVASAANVRPSVCVPRQHR
jgi:hypothetical protein